MVVVGAVGALSLVFLAFVIYKLLKSRFFKKLLGQDYKEPYVAVSKEPAYHNHLVDEISLSNTSGAGRTQFVQVHSFLSMRYFKLFSSIAILDLIKVV